MGPNPQGTRRIFVAIASFLLSIPRVGVCPERLYNCDLERLCECVAVAEACRLSQYKLVHSLILPIAVGAPSSCACRRMSNFVELEFAELAVE
jgi:hypothetical protein